MKKEKKEFCSYRTRSPTTDNQRANKGPTRLPL